MRTRQDLIALVRALPVTEERRDVVLMELEDHVFEEMAELEANGHSREDAERLAVAALGTAAVLRRGLADVNRAFSFGWRDATVAGAKLGAWFGGAIWLSWLWADLADAMFWRLHVHGGGTLALAFLASPLFVAVLAPAIAFFAGLPDHSLERFRSHTAVEPFAFGRGFFAKVRTATLAERRENLRRVWARRADFSWVAMLVTAPLVAWIPFQWEEALSAFSDAALGVSARPDPVIAQTGLMLWVWLSLAIPGCVVVARILQRSPHRKDPERIA